MLKLSTPPYLQMREISYTFAGWPAVVRNVDWDITRGEFHCLLGRSGCGKTTLLTLAAGLLMPDAGQIRVDGEPVVRPGSQMGFVFQAPTLLEWLTVGENIVLPITLHRAASDADLHKVSQLLSKMGLSAHQNHYPRELSGGQQSRVAIARALISEPDILLMDEPFAALDAITREELQDDLQAICAEHKTSVFFVTHDIAEAVYLADRVAVMDQGMIHHDMPVELPRPRRREMRYGPAFNRICEQLRLAMDCSNKQ